MEMSQLQNFIVTAEEGSMTKAADILLLSQPALSRSISSLESELGVPLFDRKNRKMVLNRHGKAFLTDAKALMQRWEHSKLQMKEMIHPTLGNISTAFVHSLGIAYVPEILKAFQLENPGYTLTLQEAKAGSIIKDLLTNEVDFGFATQFRIFPELEYTPLFKDNLVLIVSAHHPFTESQEKISIHQVAQEPLIHYNPDTELKKLIDAAFAARNETINIAYEGLEVNSIIGMVRANLGVAFIAESIVPTISGIRAIPIHDFKIERPIYLIHKKQGFLSNAALDFKEFVLRHHDINRT
ncbi:LysR family transcriptional regulator [Salicibibacter halophilus]|nr:LysR family transcriptional regulator [Salicibibacter halophilus]